MTIRFATVGFAALLSIATFSTASAYTAEQEQLCTGDAMRLCSSEIPDVERVTACMVRQRAALSEGCRSVFRAPAPAAQAQPVNASRPLNLTPAKVKRPGA
jgi:hypothetical protein